VSGTRFSPTCKMRRVLKKPGTAKRPQESKKFPVTLVATDSIDAAFHAILSSCVRHFAANRAVTGPRRPEAHHQMRIALRRLRTALSLFKSFLPPGRLVRLRAEIVWLSKSMGLARDIEVFLQDMRDVDLAGRTDLAVEMKHFRRDLEAIRRHHNSKAVAALKSARCARFLSLASGTSLTPPSQRRTGASRDDAVLAWARKRLNRRHRKIRNWLSELDNLTTSQRHALRIEIKKLRYSAEFFLSIFDHHKRRRTKMQRLVGELQDILGRLNDLAVHQNILAELAGLAQGKRAADDFFAMGFVEGRHETIGKAYRRAARRATSRFLKQAPFWR
jgi:triphosphatase